jgi:hypothetical protein
MMKPTLGIIRPATGLSHKKLSFGIEGRNLQAPSEVALRLGKITNLNGIQCLLPLRCDPFVVRTAPPTPGIKLPKKEQASEKHDDKNRLPQPQ